MICLIAGTANHAKRWAKSQNLRDEEWFFPTSLFDLMRRKNYHTIMVLDGIEHLTNDQLNSLLTAAWQYGKRK